jgi:multidrug efflux system membrane fusion protein
MNASCVLSQPRLGWLPCMLKRRLVFGSIVIGTTLVAAACSAGGESAPPPQRGDAARQAPAVPVTAAQVVQKSMPIDIRVIGSAEPYSAVAVRAQITGELTTVSFQEGEDVSQGQVLFTLDRRPLDAALQQAQAALERDLAQMANAKAQAQRYRDLAERGIATREQIDQTTANAGAIEATVGADRAAIENAKVQLQYATIVAPISGRTGALMVQRGNLVRANDTTPLVVINEVIPIYVSFSLPEAQLPNFKRYMAAGSVRIEALAPNDTGAPAVGRITFIDNAVDRSTGTIKIKGTFPNADRRLWPGQFLNVVVTLTTDKDAIVVPTTAVQTGQQGQYVFVVKPDQTAELRPITVARAAGDETVVKSGLKAGETVVTDGHLRLVPGSRVSVKSANTEKATS